MVQIVRILLLLERGEVDREVPVLEQRNDVSQRGGSGCSRAGRIGVFSGGARAERKSPAKRCQRGKAVVDVTRIDGTAPKTGNVARNLIQERVELILHFQDQMGLDFQVATEPPDCVTGLPDEAGFGVVFCRRRRHGRTSYRWNFT